jgi:hypothetical protein
MMRRQYRQRQRQRFHGAVDGELCQGRHYWEVRLDQRWGKRPHILRYCAGQTALDNYLCQAAHAYGVSHGSEAYGSVDGFKVNFVPAMAGITSVTGGVVGFLLDLDANELSVFYNKQLKGKAPIRGIGASAGWQRADAAARHGLAGRGVSSSSSLRAGAGVQPPAIAQSQLRPDRSTWRSWFGNIGVLRAESACAVTTRPGGEGTVIGCCGCAKGGRAGTTETSH